MIVPVFTVTATNYISVNTEPVSIQSSNIPTNTGETDLALSMPWTPVYLIPPPEP